MPVATTWVARQVPETGGETAEKSTRFDSNGPSLTFDMESLLHWACLAAAQVRRDPICIGQHRRALLARGETPGKLDALKGWRTFPLFSDRQRVLFDLSEAISRGDSSDEIGLYLRHAGNYFNHGELVHVTARVTAVNEWIDIYGESPIRVLVVEDNLNDQELLHRQLQSTSFGDQVLFLSDPRHARDLIEGPSAKILSKQLMAVFLDIHLPHMSGIDLLQILRRLPVWQSVPVIVMTTSVLPETVSVCKELKVMAVLEKPVTVRDFTQALTPLFHQPVKKTSSLATAVQM